MEILSELERHYGDIQDTEFTVEEGQRYMLLTRNAKRLLHAAVHWDFVWDFTSSRGA
jgi:pyruvate,orthophosphate dikinase